MFQKICTGIFIISFLIAGCGDCKCPELKPAECKPVECPAPEPLKCPEITEVAKVEEPQKDPEPQAQPADSDADTVADSEKLTIESVTIARSVVKRQPVDPDTTFSLAEGQKFYAFLQVINPKSVEQHLTVSWAPGDGGKERGSYKLKISAHPKWRTWSYFSNLTVGKWEVVVRNEDNEEIARAPFEITP